MLPTDLPDADVPPRLPTGRPKIVSVRYRRTRAGRCRCRVELAWGAGTSETGAAEGLCSPSGDLRCAAEACLAALARGVPEPAFDLVGVKSIRAFDSTLIVAALAVRGDRSGRRLVGSVLAGRNPVPAAVRAVLHAVNRAITPDTAMRGATPEAAQASMQ